MKQWEPKSFLNSQADQFLIWLLGQSLVSTPCNFGFVRLVGSKAVLRRVSCHVLQILFVESLATVLNKVVDQS